MLYYKLGVSYNQINVLVDTTLNYNLMLCFRQVKRTALPLHIGRAALFCSGCDLRPAGQDEGDPVLGVDRHAVNRRSPLACSEFGGKLRQGLDGFKDHRSGSSFVMVFPIISSIPSRSQASPSAPSTETSERISFLQLRIMRPCLVQGSTSAIMAG